MNNRLLKNLSKYKLKLASKSPRRRQLLSDLGIEFSVVTDIEVNETYPDNLIDNEIALFLAQKKARAYQKKLQNDELLITADTIVCYAGTVLGKPENKQQAYEMLQLLSGNWHSVITGVCIATQTTQKTFFNQTKVQFSTLNNDEIMFYIEKYQPFDKAGAYGIQDWIGYIGIKKITGCYYNVMGLPVFDLYQKLKELNV